MALALAAAALGQSPLEVCTAVVMAEALVVAGGVEARGSTGRAAAGVAAGVAAGAAAGARAGGAVDGEAVDEAAAFAPAGNHSALSALPAGQSFMAPVVYSAPNSVVRSL